MDLEAIQGMWAKDSIIDDILIDEAAIKIPQLHSKYLSKQLNQIHLMYFLM